MRRPDRSGSGHRRRVRPRGTDRPAAAYSAATPDRNSVRYSSRTRVTPALWTGSVQSSGTAPVQRASICSRSSVKWIAAEERMRHVHVELAARRESPGVPSAAGPVGARAVPPRRHCGTVELSTAAASDGPAAPVASVSAGTPSGVTKAPGGVRQATAVPVPRPPPPPGCDFRNLRQTGRAKNTDDGSRHSSTCHQYFKAYRLDIILWRS